jgi:hypothetical protein
MNRKQGLATQLRKEAKYWAEFEAYNRQGMRQRYQWFNMPVPECYVEKPGDPELIKVYEQQFLKISQEA